MFIINYCIIIINAYNNYIFQINSQYNYYIDSKELLKECDKESNLEVTAGCYCFLFTQKTVNPLPNVTYSPSLRQTGASTINIQSTLRIAPDLCKIVSLQFYLVATVVHIQPLVSRIHTLVLHNIETLVFQRNKHIDTAVNSKCHVGNACHSFDTPALDNMRQNLAENSGSKNIIFEDYITQN